MQSWWALMLALALLSGCLDAQRDGDSGAPAPEASPHVPLREGRSAGEEATAETERSPIEDFVIDASRDIFTEVCDDQGTIVYPVMTFQRGAPRIHFLVNETRTTLDFNWDAVNPTAERFRFELFSDGARVKGPVGPSPQHWEVAAPDIERLGEAPYLLVYPACDAPGTAASHQGQSIMVHVEHFT